MRGRVVARFAAAVLVLAALLLAGCGGGSEPPPAGASGSAAPAAAPPPPPPAAAAAAPAASPRLSPKETLTAGEMFPTKPEATPEAVGAALASKQPMLVFFYKGDAVVTVDEQAEIAAAMEKYRGLIDLISFDLSVPPTAKGSKGKAAQEAVLLATQLKVATVPYIVVTDKNGTITWRSRGFVDRQIIEREILRATQ